MGKVRATAWIWLPAGLGGGLYAARTTAEFGPLALPWWGVVSLAIVCALVGAAVARQVQRRVDLRPLLAAWVYVVYPALDLGIAASVGLIALVGTLIANVETAQPALKDHPALRLALPTTVFVLALALYVATLAPDLLAADNAEYQLVAHHLGVAHPPGYALYTMIGKLFALLPLNTPAWRVNLFAAVTGALTLALVARTAQRLTHSAWGGAAAALALGTAPTFWAQSTTANIRSLTILFTAWCFDALVAFGQALRLYSGQALRQGPVLSGTKGSGQARQRGETGQRALSWFALGLGLGVGHHLSLGFLLPAFGLYLLVTDPSLARQPRRWIQPGLVFLSTFVVLAYFPIRGAMGAVLAPDRLTTLAGFLAHVLARGFGGDMFAFLHWGVLPHRFAVLGDILEFQFGGPLLVVAGLGALALLWRDKRRFLLFGFGFGLFYFLVATYRAPQTVEYLMPAYVPVAVAVGYTAGTMRRIGVQGRNWLSTLSLSKGAALQDVHPFRLPLRPFDYAPGPLRPWAAGPRALAQGQRAQDRLCSGRGSGQASTGSGCSGDPVGALLVALILLSGILRLVSHHPSFAALHHDRTARDYAEPILRDAPPGAVILSNWHWSMAFRYLQWSEGLRPDVEVIYVYPQGESYAANWVACIEGAPDALPECLDAEPTRRPLITTNYWPGEYGVLPHRFVPFGQAYLVQREPLLASPPGLAPLDTALEDQVRLVGYHLNDEALRPGRSLVVHLAWQPLAEWERDYSFFVQLLGPAGLVGQGKDAIHPAGRYQIGEIVVDRFEVAVWPTVTPGDYALIAGVYLTPAGGDWQRLVTPGGQDHVSLDTVRVEAPASPPVTLHPLRYRFVDGPALRLRPWSFGPGTKGSGPALLGADFDHSPGQPRRVYLHWQLPVGTGDGYDVWLRADGEPVAQGHLPALPGGGYLTTAHDVPAGSLAVTVRPAGDEGSLPRIGAWGLQLSRPVPLPDPPPGSRFVPLGGEMALTSVQTRRGIKLSAEERQLLRAAEGDGEILQVDLRWLSLGALTRDRVVSVQADVWGALHDSVPALGAIPTLKWIRETTVRDRHFLLLPQEASGAVDLELIVYDHFTHQPLALLDDRLAKLGNTIPLTK